MVADGSRNELKFLHHDQMIIFLATIQAGKTLRAQGIKTSGEHDWECGFLSYDAAMTPKRTPAGPMPTSALSEAAPMAILLRPSPRPVKIALLALSE